MMVGPILVDGVSMHSIQQINALPEEQKAGIYCRLIPEDMLHQFGIEVEHTNYKTFSIKGNQRYRVGDYTIEGDWSGAAFLLVVGAIAGNVLLTGLDINSPQADRKIIPALRAAGAAVAGNGSRYSGALLRIDKAALCSIQSARLQPKERGGQHPAFLFTPGGQQRGPESWTHGGWFDRTGVD